MGEELAAKVEALFEETFEHDPIFRRMIDQGGLGPAEMVDFLLAVTGALRSALVYLATQVDDPA
jgi:hypothetical protein